MKKNNISTSHNPTTGLYELNIDGQVFTSKEKDEFLVPLSVIEHININEFPVGITISPEPDNIPKIADDILILPRIKNINGKIAQIDLNCCPMAKNVAHDIRGYELYQEALIDLFILNKKLNPTIRANYFDHANDQFHFHCSIELPANTVGVIFYTTYKFFYSSRWRVLDASHKLHQLLRKKLKLPAKPNKLAKVKY